MKIFKYKILVQHDFIISMPGGSEILSFQVQTGTPVIWVAVPDDRMQYEARYFKLIGTGHEFDLRNKKYIGTIQMNEGTLIWHLFEDVLP